MVLHEASNLIETNEHKALSLVHSVERIMSINDELSAYNLRIS